MRKTSLSKSLPKTYQTSPNNLPTTYKKLTKSQLFQKSPKSIQTIFQTSLEYTKCLQNIFQQSLKQSSANLPNISKTDIPKSSKNLPTSSKQLAKISQKSSKYLPKAAVRWPASLSVLRNTKNHEK